MGSVLCCFNVHDVDNDPNPIFCSFCQYNCLGNLITRFSCVCRTLLQRQGSNGFPSSSMHNYDTYRSPPIPLPYNDHLCSIQQIEKPKGSNHCHVECGGSGNKQKGSKLSIKQGEVLGGLPRVYISSDDEDICPTCLEEYTPENPMFLLQCSHHFHLACIYEWMERSEACPVCGKAMLLNGNGTT